MQAATAFKNLDMKVIAVSSAENNIITTTIHM